MHLNYEGIIPILGGIYGLLLAFRVLPRKPKDVEKMELWHKKFGTLMKVICPLMIAFGVVQLLGLLEMGR